MNKEILKIQAARFGIHLIRKLPYILNNGLSYELLYDKKNMVLIKFIMKSNYVLQRR